MSAVHRTPLYFGPDERPLFGWIHAPGGMRRDLAVVICQPVGHEYVNAHRSLRRLADDLARAGITTLRFDYDGCGDSAGSDEDPDRIGAWTESVRQALCFARSRLGCSRIALVGLRFGAALATLVAHEEPIDALVLWVPCARGHTCVRARTGSNRDASSDNGAIEPGGFIFSSETQQAIGRLDLSGVLPRAADVLLVARDDLPQDFTLRDAWRDAGLSVEQRPMPGFARMIDIPHNTVVPASAIAEIVTWLSERAGDECPALQLSRQNDAMSIGNVRESIVHGSGEHPFFGVLCEPVGMSRQRNPLAVLPNAGATHHVGPNRLYVHLARALAAAGVPTLRFDLPGLGDNPREDINAENDPYVPTASAVLATVIGALKQRRAADRFVLMGLCSGAHTSYHAALDVDDPSIAECVLINPLTFYYRRGMSLDQPHSNHYEEWQRYMRSMRSLSGWAKLFRDDVKIADIARNVLLRFRDIARNKMAAVRESFRGRAKTAAGENLDADLRRIAANNRRLTFVFSRFDPGYDLLMINGGRAVRSLSRRRMLSLWRIDDANHTFEAKRSRDVMIETITGHLRRTYLE
jgi:alpha-beta hydrolase superfamily lysophospholipase